MTQQEFKKLTGWEVSDEEFALYNEMYMEAFGIDKFEFCQDIKKHKDSVLLKAYYKSMNEEHQARYQENKESIEFKEEMFNFLVDEAHEMSSMKARAKAIEMFGFKNYLKKKMEKEYGLLDVDKKDLIELLDNIG